MTGDVGSTETVNVGVAGTGGAGVTTATGNAGDAATGTTSFGTTVKVSSPAGNPGNAGSTGIAGRPAGLHQRCRRRCLVADRGIQCHHANLGGGGGRCQRDNTDTPPTRRPTAAIGIPQHSIRQQQRLWRRRCGGHLCSPTAPGRASINGTPGGGGGGGRGIQQCAQRRGGPAGRGERRLGHGSAVRAAAAPASARTTSGAGGNGANGCVVVLGYFQLQPALSNRRGAGPCPMNWSPPGRFDQMRLHITEQLQRIADENKLRADALQREIDQQIAHRLDTFRLLQEELDRRFEDGRRETDERLAATVSVRVSLHEELDRRFAELREHTLETARLLQEEMDRRLTSEEVRRTDLKALLDERARNALAARASLQEEIDRRFTEAATAVRVALEGAEKAVGKAETANERRLDSVNEFRQQLGDQTASFITRNEYSAAHQSLTDKLDTATRALTERLGALELRLTSRLDTGAGRDSGQDAVRAGTRANIATGVAILAVIVSVIILVVNLTKHLRGHHRGRPRRRPHQDRVVLPLAASRRHRRRARHPHHHQNRMGAPLIRKTITASVLALAGLGLTAGVAAAAPAHTTSAPKGWHRLGGLNEAAYCATASPRMGVTVASDRTDWDCYLTIRLPRPPGYTYTYRYQIDQNYVCRWQYPHYALTVRAYHTAPGAGGWSCYVP